MIKYFACFINNQKRYINSINIAKEKLFSVISRRSKTN